MQHLIEEIWQQQKFTALLITHDVEEAVTLADRILLIEEGQIAMNLPITLARPRQRGNSAFAILVEQILKRVLSPNLQKNSSLDKTVVDQNNSQFAIKDL